MGYIKLPTVHPLATHSFMLFPIVLTNKKINRKKVLNYLEEHDIVTRYMMPLTNQPIFKKLFGNIEDKYPVAKYMNEKAFLIGIHQGLNENDLDYVASNIYMALKGQQIK